MSTVAAARPVDIVCFAKDWSEDPTSCNHVMRALAKHHRVLWLNSVGSRRPSFTSGRDLKKMGTKVVSFFKGARRVESNLWVYTPIVLPFPYSKAAARVNGSILRASIRVQRRALGMRDFQLWTFLPTTVDFVGTLGESLSAYYCTDEWSGFSHLGGEPVAEMERRLCEKVDVVFTTARPLLERKSAYNPETHLASHGVDHAHFAKALDPLTPIADDIATIRRPIVGFFGLIENWIDLDLLAFLAERRPDWSIVLIGKSAIDTAALARFPNVHLLGRRRYDDLPNYATAFDVGICPFVTNELTRNINPIKLREYLSAGLPVVASGIPEAEQYPGLATLAVGHEAFLAACDSAIRADSRKRRLERSAAMSGETWEGKALESLRTALRARARRSVASARNAA